MTLADFTRPKLCLPDITGRDPAAVLSDLSRALERERAVPASLSLFNVALNHYFFANGDTIGTAAYSLGRLASLHRTAFAVGRATEEFWWRNGCAPVQFVFLIASPANDPTESSVIAGIRQLIDDRTALRKMQGAADATAMFTALRRVAIPDISAGGGSPASAALAGKPSVQTA